MAPQLDHYIGREIEQVITYGKKSWEWGLKLSGDVVVRNLSDTFDSPSDVSGQTITSVYRSEDETFVYLLLSGGTAWGFSEGKYEIGDPAYTHVEPPKPIEELPEPTAGHSES